MQGRFRCSNEAEPGDFMFTQLDTHESGSLRQWTPVISNWINWNASWFHWPRTSHKLQFRQLPNQHGTTWAVTSTAQWTDCFWECTTYILIFNWNSTVAHNLCARKRYIIYAIKWHLKRISLQTKIINKSWKQSIIYGLKLNPKYSQVLVQILLLYSSISSNRGRAVSHFTCERTKGSLAPCLVAVWSPGGLLETPSRWHVTIQCSSHYIPRMMDPEGSFLFYVRGKKIKIKIIG